MVLEKTLESPLDSKGIQPVTPKGNKSWIFIGRTDAEAEVPILWPPDTKNWLVRKNTDTMKDWRQEEKGTTEDEMVGVHHRLNGHEFEQPPGVGDGQKSLASMGSQRVRHDWMTELNWTEDESFSTSSFLFLFLSFPPFLLPLYLKPLMYQKDEKQKENQINSKIVKRKLNFTRNIHWGNWPVIAMILGDCILDTTVDSKN